MFRLDTILEHWAQQYLPLQHNPAADAPAKERSFFRISMIDGNSYFVRTFQTVHSPACAYATHIYAELAAQNPNAASYRHVVYMLVRQAPPDLSRNLVTDDLAATEARFETDQMVQDLLAYLFALKAVVGGKRLKADEQSVLDATGVPLDFIYGMDQFTRECWRGMKLKEAHWGTLPVPNGSYNGWHICGLTIEQLQPRQLCIVPSRYKV